MESAILRKLFTEMKIRLLQFTYSEVSFRAHLLILIQKVKMSQKNSDCLKIPKDAQCFLTLKFPVEGALLLYLVEK